MATTVLKLSIDDVPDQPYGDLPQSGIPRILGGDTVLLNSSLHHIVPKSSLIKLWNEAVKRPYFHIVAEPLLTAISENADKYGAMKKNATTGKETKTFLRNPKGVMQVANTIKNNETRNSQALRLDWWDDFAATYVWLPGNLFTGPEGRMRSDDPRDKFDKPAERIITPRQYSLLADVYTNIVEYLTAPATKIGNAEIAFRKLGVVAEDPRYCLVRPFTDAHWTLKSVRDANGVIVDKAKVLPMK
ncbi:hypothetical protein [Nocardia asiatica]|uniref:hypothetical protein n=1 Tax=Nocardia asiatica TaxID=209252 RepID=UPI003EE1F89E